jgi:hypothetical protein
MWAPRTGQYFGAPWNRYYLNFFGLEQGWRNFLRERAQTVDNFRSNSFACGNLSLLAPYFRLFQWCSGAPGGCPTDPSVSPSLHQGSKDLNLARRNQWRIWAFLVPGLSNHSGRPKNTTEHRRADTTVTCALRYLSTVVQPFISFIQQCHALNKVRYLADRDVFKVTWFHKMTTQVSESWCDQSLTVTKNMWCRYTCLLASVTLGTVY